MAAFSAIDSGTRAGAVYIALFYLLTISTFVLMTRVQYRWRHLNNDDFLFVASYGVLLVYVSTVLFGLGRGLATLQDPAADDVETASKILLATQALFLAILGLLKLSTAYLIRRLCPPGYTRMIFYINGLMVCIAAGTVALIITIRIECSPSNYSLDPSASCSYQGVRWMIVAAFDLITEVLFVATATGLVIPLQMGRWLKFNCLLPMASRLIVGAIGAMHAAQLSKWSHASQPQLSIDTVLIYQALQMAFSIVLATVPILKNFVKSFDTGFGLQAGLYTSTGSSYGTVSRRWDGAVELTNVSGRHRFQAHAMNEPGASQLNPRGTQYKVEIQKGPRSDARVSLDSGNSREIMVRRVVHVED